MQKCFFFNFDKEWCAVCMLCKSHLSLSAALHSSFANSACMKSSTSSAVRACVSACTTTWICRAMENSKLTQTKEQEETKYNRKGGL